MSDHCIHEAELGAMQKTLAHLEKEIDGNGTPGLSKTMPVLVQSVNALNDSVKDLRTVISGFSRFEASYNASENQKRKTIADTLKIIGVIIAFASLLITTIEMNKKTRNIVDQYGYDMVTRGFEADTI